MAHLEKYSIESLAEPLFDRGHGFVGYGRPKEMRVQLEFRCSPDEAAAMVEFFEQRYGRSSGRPFEPEPHDGPRAAPELPPAARRALPAAGAGR